MPVADLTLCLRNTFDELPGVAEAVAVFLEARGANAETVFAANLSIEELVTNIIKYGYDDDAPHDIHVRLGLDDQTLNIEIQDDGHEFNPFDQPAPDTSTPAEERPIGGLGIHFVRHMLDSWTYERRGGRNIVTLTKKML